MGQSVIRTKRSCERADSPKHSIHRRRRPYAELTFLPVVVVVLDIHCIARKIGSNVHPSLVSDATPSRATRRRHYLHRLQRAHRHRRTAPIGAGAYIVGIVDHPYLATRLPLWLTLPSYTSTTSVVLAELGNCDVARVDPTEQELGNCDVARVDPTEQELGNCDVARVDPIEQELGNCDVARVDPTEQELGNCDVARVDLIEQELGNYDVARVDPTEQELGNCDVARVDPTEQELGNCDVARVDPIEQELGNCDVARVDPTEQELGMVTSQELIRPSRSSGIVM
ncbi:hypothetical protein BHE74_00056308 [Ensete ventricosum]|nr:hypothetical protein BHE74_00056308 [Ensete ventricosum]